jgi:hypothetical protein
VVRAERVDDDDQEVRRHGAGRRAAASEDGHRPEEDERPAQDRHRATIGPLPPGCRGGSPHAGTITRAGRPPSTD